MQVSVRCRRSIVRLDRALVSLYMLSIVAMRLTEAVWAQFETQVNLFGVQTVPLFGGIGVVGGQNQYHRVAVQAVFR